MNKYFLAYSLPTALKAHIQQEYSRLFGRLYPVNLPHITLLPPFTSSESNIENTAIKALGSLGQNPIVAYPSPPKYFVQKDKIIPYIPLIPIEPFLLLHHNLEDALEPHIDYDLAPYESGHLPPYLPHITLDYKLPVDELPKLASWKNPDRSFKFSAPSVFSYTNSGWQPLK